MSLMLSDREAVMPLDRPEMLLQVRDVGGRLEHVRTQYDRLVRELLGDGGATPDVQNSLLQVNREIGYLARRVQELLVARHEGRLKGEGGSAEKARRAGDDSHGVAAPRRVGRPSVVKPFVPAAQRQRVPAMLESSRFMAAR
jgi:hypothetical protein